MTLGQRVTSLNPHTGHVMQVFEQGYLLQNTLGTEYFYSESGQSSESSTN